MKLKLKLSCPTHIQCSNW